MRDTTLRGYGHTIIEQPFPKKVDGVESTEPGWQLLLLSMKDGELLRYPMNEQIKADLLKKLIATPISEELKAELLHALTGVVRATSLPTSPSI